MKYLFYIVVCFFVSNNVYSQSHELGLAVGGTNYIGDIGSTRYLNPNDLGYGLVYRLNRSPRHTYRLSFSRYNIKADDANSKAIHRNLRGLSFENEINEMSLGIEYSFWDFNLHNSGKQSSPYIHIGIGVMNYKEIFFSDSNLKESGRGVDFTTPITIGYKTRLINRLIFSAEISAKYTFTDNLDGSNPKIGVLNDFGTIRKVTNNDWFVFTGVMLTYTFGKRPCLCNL